MAKDGIRGKKAFFVLFAAILAAGALAPSVSFAITPERELQRLAIRQAAVKLKAWENQHWIDLLYYDKPLLGRYRSSAQDPRFFLAKWGAISPRLELEAAIDGFFYEGEPGNGPECRFPERYSWLREKFRLPVSALPQPRCAAFEEWKAGFAAETASLVFAPGDLKHSAAFHGDLFLRLKGPAGQERDAVIGCTAPAAGEGAFLSVLKAAAGAHSCSFSALPWSGARRAYAGLDDRDQWEFPLALDEEEKARLLNHLWELQNTSFSWRPFTRNSAWRLLKLLDAARPTSRGSARFHAWVLPLDAVRAAIPDAAGAAAVWRPALWKTVTWKREQLYIGEASSAYELVRGDQAAALKKLEETNAWHRAAILETASDYLGWVHYSGRMTGEDFAKALGPLEKARSSAGAQAVFTGSPEKPASPHGASESLRAGAGLVGLKNGPAYELQGRIAGQDLLDSDAGYAPGSALETGTFRLRYENRYNSFYVKEARLLRIASITPWDDWARRGSWEVSAGVEQADEAGRRSGRAAVWDMSGGYGAAMELEGAMRQVWYAMAAADSSFGPALDAGWRAGAGLKAGAFAGNGPLRLLCEARYIAYPFGDGRPLWAGTAGGSYALSRNVSLRVEYAWRGKTKESGLYLHRFFSAP
ncbi:MAG TPA: hypothetical protein DCZ92_04940 [Elusimicrobia bacterium]|nr:MAG: hypothetical protein A2016_02275 [Elusimicrobia bacterium GWF2_62_30]HBA60153.1 hypothetical protein [Elusimicrobiota bacterium]